MASTLVPAHFIPAGMDVDNLPPALQQGLQEIMEPAYRVLVQEATDALARSAGLTVVHILWLELLQQCRMAGIVTDLGPNNEVALHNHVNRVLRLATAKQHASAFLLKVRAFGQELKKSQAPRAATESRSGNGVPKN